MAFLVYVLLVVIGILAIFAVTLLVAELKVVNRLMDVNKQLILLVAGKEPNPESALRALVASAKPPRKPLPGIAENKKKDDKPKNTDYVMELGV